MSIDKLEGLLSRVQRNRRGPDTGLTASVPSASPAMPPASAKKPVSVAPTLEVVEDDEFDDRQTERPRISEAAAAAIPKIPRASNPPSNISEAFGAGLDTVAPTEGPRTSPAAPPSALPLSSPKSGVEVKPDSVAPPSTPIVSASSTVTAEPSASTFGDLLRRTLLLRLK